MTGQTLLNIMELLNQELQLQSGEADASRGLLALNVAQDFFESLAARRKILGGATGTVATVASTETTAFPSGVLRVDRLQLLGSNSRPRKELVPLQRSGGHAGVSSWPLDLAESSSEPDAYWTDGTNIYWQPLPSGVSTIRWYGFQSKADITANGTFLYPDIVALPLAAFATRIIKSGLDDNAQDLQGLAVETFKPTLDALDGFQRDGAKGLEYTQSHAE